MRRRPVATMIVGKTTLLRESLARILHPPGFRVVASKPSFADIEFAELPNDEPSLLVIEVDHGPQSILSHIADYKRHQSLGRVVLLQHQWSTGDIAAAFGAGTNACLAEILDSNELLKAIELIMLGHQTMLPAELVSALTNLAHGNGPHVAAVQTMVSAPMAMRRNLDLSTREASILNCLARGASNKVIAREINISEATVKVHVKAILRKIGVANRTQAAVWAMTNGHSTTMPTADPESASLVVPQLQD